MVSENFEIARTILTTLSVTVSLILGLIALFSFRMIKIPFGNIEKRIEKSFIRKPIKHLLVTSYEDLILNCDGLLDQLKEDQIKLQDNWKFYWFPWTIKKAKNLKKILVQSEEKLEQFIAKYYLYVKVLEHRTDFNLLQKEFERRKHNEMYVWKNKSFDELRGEFYNDFKTLHSEINEIINKI